MNVEKLFTKQTTIKISVVTIDNKKLSKSIVNQLNVSSPFDKLYNLKENAKFLGYINDKSKWIIWTNDEFIFKYELKLIYPIARINLDKNTLSDLIDIYPSDIVKSRYAFENEYGDFENRELQISNALDKKDQYILIERIEEVQKIITEILKRQILL
mgnify:CR=1 FL=1